MTPAQKKFCQALGPSWAPILHDACALPSTEKLITFLQHEYASGKHIYPPKPDIFSAFRATPYEEVKVVILGQDPYHGPGQAHGLAFSVLPGVPFPPSLKNIFKELVADVHVSMPTSGYLMPWAQQGVLLLNTLLTVQGGNPASHAGKGWEPFMDIVIQKLFERPQPMVFLLWGAHAQKRIVGLTGRAHQHLILKAGHPSPLSVRMFSGCHHFSKTNAQLTAWGQKTIDWTLP